jgi:hypothetical protein
LIKIKVSSEKKSQRNQRNHKPMDRANKELNPRPVSAIYRGKETLIRAYRGLRYIDTKTKK